MKNYGLKNWMSFIDGNTNLFSLNLPATHNSAARFLRLSFFTKCQNLSIYEQLNIGVRVLDIRVKSQGEKLLLVHGGAYIYSDKSKKEKADLNYVIDSCKRFLNENKSETVILQFKNDSEKEQEKCIDILKNKYVDKILWYLENSVPSLKDVRGRIVLLRRCKSRDSLPLGINVSEWVDQSEKLPSPMILKSGGKEYIIQDRYNYSAVKKWALCAEPLLESAGAFSGQYILNYLSTAGGIKSPKKNANIINAAFYSYKLESGKYYGVIYLDFINKALSEKIIESNSDISEYQI